MKSRALVLCEDAWHPATLVQDGLSALAEAPLDFDFMTRGDEWSPVRLKEFSVVVIAKANHLCAADQRPWLTAETQSAVRSNHRASPVDISGIGATRAIPQIPSAPGWVAAHSAVFLALNL